MYFIITHICFCKVQWKITKNALHNMVWGSVTIVLLWYVCIINMVKRRKQWNNKKSKLITDDWCSPYTLLNLLLTHISFLFCNRTNVFLDGNNSWWYQDATPCKPCLSQFKHVQTSPWHHKHDMYMNVHICISCPKRYI